MLLRRALRISDRCSFSIGNRALLSVFCAIVGYPLWYPQKGTFLLGKLAQFVTLIREIGLDLR